MTQGSDSPAILLSSGPWAPEAWADAVRELEPKRPLHVWPDAPSDRSGIGYVLAWKSPQAVFDNLANLRLVFSLGAGVDHLSGLDLPDVPVVRIVDDDLTARMTEWVVLQVLMHHRRQLVYQRQQVARQWRALAQPRADEVRVGVMGLGVLGEASARAIAALGFDVAGWSRTPKDIDGIASYAGNDNLDAFLRRTDILVCLLPLTEATRGLLARPLFARLARDGALPGPVLINAGRGASQVENDVVAALRDGTLAGASLDVFAEEPLPPASPLWDAPNLIVSPHVSAPSSPAALTRRIVRQIAAYERNGTLPDGIVDRSAWY